MNFIELDCIENFVRDERNEYKSSLFKYLAMRSLV